MGDVFPALEPDRAEPYWDAARNEAFVLPYCDPCDTYMHPRNEYCGDCRAPVSYREPTQNPELVSATTVNPVEEGYTLALVEVEEAVTILTRILDADGNDLDTDTERPTPGTDMEMAFAETADGYRLPCVTPVHNPGSEDGGWLAALRDRLHPR